jgi:hypothetical protein
MDTDGRRWWRDAPTVVAALTLAAGLVFNACQARSQTQEAAQTRIYTQISLLTEMASQARESEKTIESSEMPALACDREYRESDLSLADSAVLEDALDIYEHMAWLFNERHVAMDSARSLWTPRIIDAAELGAALLGKDRVATEWPQVVRFSAEADPVLHPPSRCPQRPDGHP